MGDYRPAEHNPVRALDMENGLNRVFGEINRLANIELFYRCMTSREKRLLESGVASFNKLQELFKRNQCFYPRADRLMISEPDEKCQCTHCKVFYPLTLEYWHRDCFKKNGFQSWCKRCVLGHKSKHNGVDIALENLEKDLPIIVVKRRIIDCMCVSCGKSYKNKPDFCSKCYSGSFEEITKPELVSA